MYNVIDVQRPHPKVQLVNGILLTFNDSEHYVNIQGKEKSIKIIEIYAYILSNFDNCQLFLNGSQETTSYLEIQNFAKDKQVQSIKLLFLKKEDYWSICPYLIYYSTTKESAPSAYEAALVYWEKSIN